LLQFATVEYAQDWPLIWRRDRNPPWDAVIEATLHRFRPILLTAAAAILGMIPIAPTVFWGPMANSIMRGLAVATVITLVFLPISTLTLCGLVSHQGAIRGAGKWIGRKFAGSTRLARLS
jgi:Cu/Ag efflux pump CusA